jgi:F-type H+-transporting ATPase subunit b
VLIDWFTVVAQILNFLILVFLLKYFLYDRIIRAMDKRNEKIRARLEEADNKKREAEKEKESYLGKKQEIEEREKELLSQAKQKAEAKRKELVAEAKEDVEAVRRRWMESVDKEKEAFLRDLRHMVGQKVYAISRRALKDLAADDIDEKAMHVFLQKIQDMPEKEESRLADAIQRSDGHMTVRTSFEVSSEMRRQVTRTLHEKLAKDLEVHYETRPELIFGIELKLRGQKIAWNLDDYLEGLEEEMGRSLETYTQEEKADASGGGGQKEG